MALSSATLSSTFHPSYPAWHALDGTDSLAASNYQAGAWISAAVPAGTRIGLVAITNRNDGVTYQNFLGSFDVYVGSSAGDMAVRCGGWSGATSSIGPFVVNCGGSTAGRYVTAVQVGAARYLTIAGLAVYEAP